MASGKAYSRVQVDASGRTRVLDRAPVIPREVIDDRQAMKVQRNTDAETAALRSRPEADGAVVLERYSLAVGNNIIMHRLGRKFSQVSLKNPRVAPAAWYLVDNDDPAKDAYQITLNVAVACVADVEVS